jgi:hypothetical protein
MSLFHKLGLTVAATVLFLAGAASAAPIPLDEHKLPIQAYRISAERQVIITASLPSAVQLLCIFVMSMIIAAMIEGALFIGSIISEQCPDTADHDVLSCSDSEQCPYHGQGALSLLDLSEKTAQLGDETILSVHPCMTIL